MKFVIHESINEGVPINVLLKQTRRCENIFGYISWLFILVIYLEKIKKQSIIIPTNILGNKVVRTG
jgi:hypothetical protein